MNYYDERLKVLKEKMAAKNRFEVALKELRKQQNELSAKVEGLMAEKQKEEADVEHLEGRSLARFFYNVVGKMDEKLTKEKQEAYEAAVKYDAAYKELKAVEEDIRFHELELGKVSRSEEEYQAAIKAKMEAVKASEMPEASEILRLEEQMVQFEIQEKEIDEAIVAGQNAERIVDGILTSLSSAEGWGTFDILGGGLLADMVKHEHLDAAQEQIEQLQTALRHLKTELADIDIQADMQVNIDGFLRFADYFFDGLFADWTVMEHISESQNQIENTQKQIADVLNKLFDMRSAVKNEQAGIKAELNNVIIETTLR